MTIKMFYQLQLFAILVVYASSYHLDLDFMTTEDMERYFSVSRPEEVPEYEIVNPTAYSAGGRRKRHIEMEETSKEIILKAFGEEFHMKLEENQQLLGEGLQVDIHNADGTAETRPLESRRCYYHGELLSHDVSRIAVSTCKGLTGMIATDKHDMYIRPLSDKHAEEYRRRRRDIENPHVIYRKSVDQETADDANTNSHFCALDPEFPHSFMFEDTMEHVVEMQAAMAAENIEVRVDFADNETVADNETNSDEIETEDVSRRKRATDPYYLEVRVMADADMYIYYNRNEEEVIRYTLTLMNIAAARYIDASLGTRIIIHIVKLDVAKSDQFSETNPENGRRATLYVSADGLQTLNSWSDFQYITNPYYDLNDARHWDKAVLISRKDLQLDGSNSLLGVAWGNATCYAPRAASVNQDAGLSSGIVIAHEIGHTLGMDHDNINGCQNGVNVMSSHRPNGAGSFVWSSCSATDLSHFLSSPYKRCLDDTPVNLGSSSWPLDAQHLPGSTISADEQCRLLFGGVAESCTNRVPEDICKNLFCRVSSGGSCSSLVAAAEGTYCGPGKWCISGQCVVNNQWRVENGPCSVTCGNGIYQKVVRCFSLSANTYVDDSQCDSSSRPSSQGPCSADPCPSQWVRLPGTCSTSCGDGVALETIICKSASGQTVADNQCNPSTKPTPTQSSCFVAECPAYWQPFPFEACSVTCGAGTQTRDVWCMRSTGPNLVRLEDNQCDPTVKPATTVACTGTAPCPEQGVWVTSEFTQCSVTCGGGSRIRTVTCQTSATSQQILPESQCPGNKPHATEACNEQKCPSGVWVTSAFSQCSVSCGGGSRTRTVTCRSSETSQQILPESQCSRTKPHTTEDCNQQSCPTELPEYTWFESSTFVPCSVTCGTGIQTTLVLCIRVASNQEVADVYCSSQTKPQVQTQQCALSPCSSPGVWETTQFSECSVSCGQGIRERQVFCRSATGSADLPRSSCDPNTEPSTQLLCNNGDCPVVGVQCGHVYTSPINNLDHISVSTDNKNCKESIVAAPGQQIKLIFNRCNILCSQGIDRAFVLDGFRRLNLCCEGGNDDGGDPYTWTSSTHVIQLEHVTKEANHGYDITVEFVGQPSNGCDRVFTSPTGTVTSPNYPQNYNNNQLCQSVIIAPAGKRVELHYEEIKLHSWYWNYCINDPDVLEVYDIDSGDGRRYCGTFSNPRLEQPPHDNRVLIQFTSNNDGVVGEGFKISYSFVDA